MCMSVPDCMAVISFPDQNQCKRKNLEIRPAVLVVLTSVVEAPVSMSLGLHVKQTDETPIASDSVHM